MSESSLSPSVAPVGAASLDEVEQLVRARLHGRIIRLSLERSPEGLILHGLASTYYAKQLAQHAVMEETDLPIAANRIEVMTSRAGPSAAARGQDLAP